MKHRISTKVRVVLALFAAVALCGAMYYFADNALNGTFVEWFEENYMLTESRAIPGTECYELIREPIYWKLKELVFRVFTGSVVFWLLVIFGTVHFVTRARGQKSVTQISEKIYRFMHEEREAAEIFPKEYAEISAQMAEIKSTMQRHEQILREEAARKNDLITYLAHDLKTPLTSVIGYLSLLDEVKDMPSQQREKYVTVTLNKAKRLEELTNEFFEITRYNLQHIQLEKEAINLCYMLVQMTDEFYPLLAKKGNTTELQVEETLTVHADGAKLARVFNNILKNALAYSYPDTMIRIWTEQTGEQVSIYFQNHGKTIPSHKLETIFEKFFRLDEARTSNTGGAGLGLAIAKEIVEAHNGMITAKSSDEVTTFCVVLPLDT